MLRRKINYKKFQESPTASPKEIQKFINAIQSCDVEAIAKFVGIYGKDRDSMNALKYDQNALDRACYYASTTTSVEKFERYVKIIKIILSSPVIDVNGIHGDKSTAPPLHIAARYDIHGKTDILKLLLKDARVEKNRLHNGKTALHLTVENLKTANVAALIACEAVDVNAKIEESQKTALHLAAEGKHLPITNILLNRREIDINARCKSGNTPAHTALLHGQGQIACNIIQRPEFTVNAQNENGTTVLSLAVDKKSKKTFSLLLTKADIDINLAAPNGETPLIKALKTHNSSMAAILLARPEIKVCIQDQIGFEALHWAADSGNLDALKTLLLRQDIDVNAKVRGDGLTPLIVAVNFGNIEAVKLLLAQKNIDVNAFTQKHGNSALTTAAKHNNALIIRLLLDHGADASHINNSGYTARMIAADAGHFGIAELLSDAEKSQKAESGSPLQKHSFMAKPKVFVQQEATPEAAQASPKI